MKPEGSHDRDFDHHMSQLLQLLKKIFGSQFKNGPWQDFLAAQKSQGMNINIGFFSFFPMSSEELEELEDLCEDLHEGEEDETPLNTELNSSDLDFLRRHGIQF